MTCEPQVRLDDALDRCPVAVVSVGPLRVSASIGVAVSEEGQQPQELLRRADRAMYRVKLGRSAGSLGR